MIGSAGLASAAAALVGLGAAVATSAAEQSPGSGHADRLDRGGYLAYLDHQEVGYPSAAEAVDWGRRVCEALHARVPLVGVGREVMGWGFEPLQAAHIVNGAAGLMCPDTADYVRHQMVGLRQVRATNTGATNTGATNTGAL